MRSCGKTTFGLSFVGTTPKFYGNLLAPFRPTTAVWRSVVEIGSLACAKALNGAEC